MKRWNVISEYDNNSPLLDQILRIKGVKDFEEFLNPKPFSFYSKTFSPELKRSLLSAKRLIEDTVSKNLPIVIHGDYDADGICATSILYNTIKKELGHNKTFYFIPNRFDHGYGVSTKSVDEVLSKIPNEKALFITVDSGITSVTEVEYIKKLGHEVIITDHHQKPTDIPKAYEIVWTDAVVGSSVSWILSRVLGSKDPASVSLAAIATITDLYPVLGINRSLVKKGLEILNNNPPLGIKYLMEYAGKLGGEITAYDLGWVIGPRLNASGRLLDANEAVGLFTEDNPESIKKIAQKLHELNLIRQDKTFEMYDLISGIDDNDVPKIIFTQNEEYHEGIIGLIAGKLTQRYYRPSVVISLNDGFGKGSVRSIPGIDIISILRKFEDLFENLGGHPMAAGFTIKVEKITILKDSLEEYFNINIQNENLIPELLIDMKIPAKYIDLDFSDEIDKLKPFGLGNEEPLFLSTGLKVTDVSTVGKEGQHLSIKLYQDDKNFKTIYFNGTEKNLNLKMGDTVDLVYIIKKNTYNNKTYIDFVVRDLKKSEL